MQKDVTEGQAWVGAGGGWRGGGGEGFCTRLALVCDAYTCSTLQALRCEVDVTHVKACRPDQYLHEMPA